MPSASKYFRVKKERFILDKAELKKLKAAAHHLKAELNLGKDGFSKTWLKSLRQAFQTKELLKIKILDNCPQDRDEIKQHLNGIADIHHVQSIGNVITLFKASEEAKK